eukprot:TRINITY_DN6933_c0_g1_i1.p1 TRINITY_DN6933_c0_g1~~TRINITY_DN6933_c0_g1_i1.p1  ORF type:complete len:314 (-),score=85.29 TRINITY_DN6933_c0_g1_i1:53-973(-)
MKSITSLVLTLLVALLCVGASLSSPTYRPVVLWHGMGDSCCNPLSMGALKKIIEQTLPGIEVFSIEIGDSEDDDIYNSFFKNVNDQLEMVAQNLSATPALANGFNAVGFSQGGQFWRGYVERYNNPKVHNLVSVGGQHQGVCGLPNCPGGNSSLCKVVREMIDIGVYVDIVQDTLVQAEYWQDPYNLDKYLDKSIFLADINNQHDTKNSTYAKNLKSVNNFAMVKFTEDTMVFPKESEWFDFFYANQTTDIEPLVDTPLYQEDWIGLKHLDQKNKIQYLAVEGNHLQFNTTWFVNYIVGPYFNNTL